MAKFCGIIGFVGTKETRPGVWEAYAEERKYKGDIIDNSHRYQQSNETVNDSPVLSIRIEIVADSFVTSNLAYMRYVEYMGAKWKIESINSANYPRITLTIGGLYNGQTDSSE